MKRTVLLLALTIALAAASSLYAAGPSAAGQPHLGTPTAAAPLAPAELAAILGLGACASAAPASPLPGAAGLEGPLPNPNPCNLPCLCCFRLGTATCCASCDACLATR